MCAVLKIDEHKQFFVYALKDGRVKLAERIFWNGSLVCLVDKRGRFYTNSVRRQYRHEFVCREAPVVEAAWRLGAIPAAWYELYRQQQESREKKVNQRSAAVDFEEAAKTLGITLTAAQTKQVSAAQAR